MQASEQSGKAVFLCNFIGIPVRLHLSIPLLLLWFAATRFAENSTILVELLFAIGVVVSIALHEFAHVAIGRLLSVQTRSITLYPFGGISSSTAAPSERIDLWIALAGPFTSFLLCLYFAESSLESLFFAEQTSLSGRIAFFNGALALLNLFPAWPLDGGRMLRALLSLGGATQPEIRASRAGQLFALVFCVLALVYGQLLLLAIAIVILVTATQQVFLEQARSVAEDFSAGDVMFAARYLLSLPHGTPVSEASREAIRTGQTAIPIMLAENVIGVIDRSELISTGLSVSEELLEDAYVSELADREFVRVSTETPLSEILERMSEGLPFPFVVEEDGQFSGLIERNQLLEFLMLARSNGSPTRKSSGGLHGRSDEHRGE